MLKYAFAAGLLWLGAAAATAEVVVMSLVYREGPYAGGGTDLADGYADYFTLLNERDGGINGVPVTLLECEFGYNTDRGLACYEEAKSAGSVVVQPWSTGVTIGVLPKSVVDNIPVHTMGYGVSGAADGSYFSHAFNFPAHYLHATYGQLAHIREVEGTLRGKRIGLVHHNSSYGKSPIPLLEEMQATEGFEVTLYPVDHPGEEQAETWDKIASDKPDYLLLWGWGIMNPTAIGEAARIDYPMDRIIGVWWSASSGDMPRRQEIAHGYKAVTFHAYGHSFEIFNDLNEYVYFGGKAAGDMNNIGTALYNRGVVAAIFASEAARKAMEIHNTTAITPAMMRDGYEALDVSAERLEELGMGGFVPPIRISCRDHVGPGQVAVVQWNKGLRKFKQISDFYRPNNPAIDAIIRRDAEAFAEKTGIQRRRC
ncbi:MAG: ABC transporter substrate-binding protein [Pseudomonadota bacterium]